MTRFTGDWDTDPTTDPDGLAVLLTGAPGELLGASPLDVARIRSVFERADHHRRARPATCSPR